MKLSFELAKPDDLDLVRGLQYEAVAWLAAALVAAAVLYFTWYRNLPPAEVPDEVAR